jgi:hypothetical protein
MRLEHVPLILGVLVSALGIGLIVDAWLADDASVPQERRRRARAERHRVGEGVVGAGVLCMASALIGGDSWRFGTLAVILGALLLVTGAVLNRRYLRELFAFRGPARRRRRRPEGEIQTGEHSKERLRIR